LKLGDSEKENITETRVNIVLTKVETLKIEIEIKEIPNILVKIDFTFRLKMNYTSKGAHNTYY
jgi:hypothetical protein